MNPTPERSSRPDEWDRPVLVLESRIQVRVRVRWRGENGGVEKVPLVGKESEDKRSEICQSQSTARQSQMPEERYSLVKLQKSPELSRSCSPVVHPPVLASKALNPSDQTRPLASPPVEGSSSVFDPGSSPALPSYPATQPNPNLLFNYTTSVPIPCHAHNPHPPPPPPAAAPAPALPPLSFAFQLASSLHSHATAHNSAPRLAHSWTHGVSILALC